MKAQDNLSDDQRALVLEKFVQEVKLIWSHIKAIVGLSICIDGWEESAKKATLARFDDSKGAFKFIKRQHLENNELYSVTESNAYRDFRGALLHMMVKSYFKLDISVRRLNAMVNKHEENITTH
jgi:hypothetical protein